MSLKLSGWNDTIVALATPPGIGALGIIRLSGDRAVAIVNELFASKNLEKQKSHTIHFGLLKQGTKVLDEVVVSLFKGPHSYTGENVVEISCHGSPFIHQQVIESCIEKGARLAKPGEFTQRAFLNGKLDLTQAESVADLISSSTSASHKTAITNIRGGFSSALKSLREQLLKFSALIELELDFSQEDVEFVDRTELKNLLQQAKVQTTQLLDSFRLGNVIKNGVSVAIVGKPNVGKSTLLNTLLNEERAIVSEIAGTTRDTIEELINIDGLLFRLIDTAGIRSHSTDSIEKIGIQKSLDKMQQANLVLYLFDVNEITPHELKTIDQELKSQAVHYLMIGNKVDVVDEVDVREKFSQVAGIVFISAKTNLYVQLLKERMIGTVLLDKLDGENIIVTNARHYSALKKLSEAQHDIYEALENNLPSDLLALDIRTALQYLGEITGEITNEDQLDFIFSKFCIGK